MLEERPCILVVEDHDPIREAIRMILEDEGFRVLAAPDGVDALRMMEKTRPDLIIADIMMPRMDGLTFYRAVRERPEWLAIPFIFLTALGTKEDILRGKEMGAEEYLVKPFDPQDLVRIVRARLRRAREVEQARTAELDRLKQQIVAVLSHELRTPLTYIIGYTDLALEDLSALSPGMLQEALSGIKRGADRLARLVNDLLLLILLDSGQAAEEVRLLSEVRTDLRDIIQAVVDRYRPQAHSAGLVLECVVPTSLPPVRICEMLFQDALGRLVDNGIKFTRGKGSQVRVEASSAGDRVQISVIDDGIGIPEVELPHLFERFRQINRERQEQQGMGLGLAIARELIRLHGGDITVRSRFGEGSTFTIWLPVARPET